MKILQHQRRPAGFTLVELLTVIAIIGLLAAMLMPSLMLGKQSAKRMVCVNNERELGAAFHMFLHDHDSKFPMAVSMSDGGSEESVENGQSLGGEFDFSYRSFQVLSNYSAQPEELVCPADDREAAMNMGRLKNLNLSYFVGVNANYNHPESILAGDRNVSLQMSGSPTIEELVVGSRLHWTQEIHRYKGDVLFSDGHVELWNQLNLAANLHGRLARVVLFLPSISQFPLASGNGFNRPNPAYQPADHPDAGSGNPATAPEPQSDNSGRSTPPPHPSLPGASETTPAPTPTVIPLPVPVAGTTPARLEPGSSTETSTARAPGAGTTGGFQAFITSGWWFWLFLLLLLGVLAEAWRRVAGSKTGSSDTGEN